MWHCHITGGHVNSTTVGRKALLHKHTHTHIYKSINIITTIFICLFTYIFFWVLGDDNGDRTQNLSYWRVLIYESSLHESWRTSVTSIWQYPMCGYFRVKISFVSFCGGKEDHKICKYWDLFFFLYTLFYSLISLPKRKKATAKLIYLEYWTSCDRTLFISDFCVEDTFIFSFLFLHVIYFILFFHQLKFMTWH